MLEKFLQKTLYFKIKPLNLWAQTYFLFKCDYKSCLNKRVLRKWIEFAVDTIFIPGMLHINTPILQSFIDTEILTYLVYNYFSHDPRGLCFKVWTLIIFNGKLHKITPPDTNCTFLESLTLRPKKGRVAVSILRVRGPLFKCWELGPWSVINTFLEAKIRDFVKISLIPPWF